MKKQKITKDQYVRSNKTMFIILMMTYIIFMVVEFTNSKTTGMDTFRIARIAAYVAMIVIDGIVSRLLAEKKAAMLFMAISYVPVYALLVFANGVGALTMAFPVLIGFMVYLNTPLVFIGCLFAFVICVVKSAIERAAGNVDLFNLSNLTTMAFLISIFGAYRSIDLLIQFSKEDQESIKKEAEHRAEVAQTVTQIVAEMETKFKEVLEDLHVINTSMDTVHAAMDGIAGSSENTADAANRQAEMTGNIQTRLEKTNNTALEAVDTAGKLKEVVVNGKELADALQEQSILVDQNTARISETVEMLVNNVQKVSNITEAILNISGQTNLLALNASIEAARAGEAGRGFAVVADQIRKLAEETKVSTEQITEIISELTAITDETQSGIEESAENISIQRQRVDAVTASFAEVETGMTGLEEDVKSMGHEARAVLKSNKEIVDSISQLSAASEEVSAGTLTSKEIIDGTFEKLHQFSDVVETTFEQLQVLKEATEA